MVQHVSKFGLYRWITCLNLQNTGIDTTNYVKVYEATLRPGERNKMI